MQKQRRRSVDTFHVISNKMKSLLGGVIIWSFDVTVLRSSLSSLFIYRIITHLYHLYRCLNKSVVLQTFLRCTRKSLARGNAFCYQPLIFMRFMRVVGITVCLGHARTAWTAGVAIWTKTPCLPTHPDPTISQHHPIERVAASLPQNTCPIERPASRPSTSHVAGSTPSYSSCCLHCGTCGTQRDHLLASLPPKPLRLYPL